MGLQLLTGKMVAVSNSESQDISVLNNIDNQLVTTKTSLPYGLLKQAKL
jgi:hypothetical protein